MGFIPLCLTRTGVGLEFTTAGTVNVTQNPIVQNIPVGVPEPSGLLGFGLLGLGFLGRKTRS